ncbi:MAG: hypothetical protein AB1499_10905 [Nitrospirota bacterium]
MSYLIFRHGSICAKILYVIRTECATLAEYSGKYKDKITTEKAGSK